jgi:protein-S-isoprenylcysteine O-methyltransferase Ste14
MSPEVPRLGAAEGLWLAAKNLTFLVLVPGYLGCYVPLRYLAARPLSAVSWGPREVIAAAAIGCGLAGVLWCFWHFAVTGRGTPAPFDPPRRLVVRGLYRVVRNPMYLSVLTAVAGQALLLGSWAIARYALAGLVFFHVFVIGVEEPGLRARFGADYEAYCRAVRRWIPGRPYRAPD